MEQKLSAFFNVESGGMLARAENWHGSNRSHLRSYIKMIGVAG